MSRPKTRQYLQLRPADVPKVLLRWVKIFCPGQEGIAWLCENNKVYENRSPLSMLSVWHDLYPDELHENVRRIVEGFHDVLAYVSVPYAASAESVYQDVIEAQEAFLNRTFGSNEAQRDLRFLPSVLPPKLFPTGRMFSHGSSESLRPAA